MSDPTEIYYCLSVGFFTNHRKMALERKIGERANFVPQILMAYAAVNQRNGDFSTYDDEDFRRIFQANGLLLSPQEAKKYVAALRGVGFLDSKGHLHSWEKFNRFFSNARFRKAARAKWRKERQRRREEAERSRAHQNGNGSAKHEPKPPPLFREIESLQAVIDDKKEVLKKIKVPCQKWDEGRRDLIDPPERKAALDRRAPLVTEIAELEAKVKELHYRQARVRA